MGTLYSGYAEVLSKLIRNFATWKRWKRFAEENAKNKSLRKNKYNLIFESLILQRSILILKLKGIDHCKIQVS